MQFPSLLWVVALLGYFTLLSRGLPIATTHSTISTIETDVTPDVSTHHSLEPRMFARFKTKYRDAVERRRQRKNKENESGGTTNTDVDDTANAPRLPAPAKYEGPPPPGMTEGAELDVWNKFVDIEHRVGNTPPENGGYMMYSGQTIKDSTKREPFKVMMSENGNGKLHDWSETYRGTEASSMWIDYERNNPATKHIISYALSWGQARRAANDKPDLAILYATKDEPLMKENTYWGAIEAGMITGPDSKVQKIWRYNADEVESDTPPEPQLVWDRDVHEPFGKTDNDWKKNPRDSDVPENALLVAKAKGL